MRSETLVSETALTKMALTIKDLSTHLGFITSVGVNVPLAVQHHSQTNLNTVNINKSQPHRDGVTVAGWAEGGS